MPSRRVRFAFGVAALLSLAPVRAEADCEKLKAFLHRLIGKSVRSAETAPFEAEALAKPRAAFPVSRMPDESFEQWVVRIAKHPGLTLVKITEGEYSAQWVMIDGKMVGVFKPSNATIDQKIVVEKGYIHPFLAVKREVATQFLDEQIGFLIVPRTTETGIQGVHGSFQELAGDEFRTYAHLWYTDRSGEYRQYDEFKMQEISRVDLKELKKLMLLDLLSGNTDRHFSNWMTTREGGSIRAIDNGNTFPVRTGLHKDERRARSWVLGNQMDQTVDADLREKVLGLNVTQVAQSLEARFGIEPRATSLFRERAGLLQRLLNQKPEITLREILAEFNAQEL